MMFAEPLKIQSLMRNFKSDWFVAGGWAIDLYLETETRRHDDIEIAIFRRDQIELQSYFAGWRLQKVRADEFSIWQQAEFLELPTHEIHCHKENAALQSFEVLLNEINEDDEWIFRRNVKVTTPLSKLHLTSNLGIKFLRPEIVLLYKSKNPRAKDEQDFITSVKHLDVESRSWLKNALSFCYEEHHWLQNL
jgi:hypothetical protein